MAVERQCLRGTNVERIQQVGSSERAEREGIRIESSVRELRSFLKEYPDTLFKWKALVVEREKETD